MLRLERPPGQRVSGWSRPVVVRVVPALALFAWGMAQLLRNLPLWYDEAYSRLAAQAPIATLFSAWYHRTGLAAYLTTVPPSFNAPYYVLLHLWSTVAGTDAFALRLPSLLCAVGAVVVITELVRRQAGPGAALLCGLLTATGPLFADEATQARGYGPALLALSLCALWFLDWRRTGDGLVRVGVAAVAAGLLHWFTLPVLIGFAVTALIDKRRRAALVLLAAAVPAALLAGWSMLGGAAGAPTPAVVGTSLAWQALLDWSRGCWPLSVALALAALAAIRRSEQRVLLLCWVLLAAAVPAALLAGWSMLGGATGAPTPAVVGTSLAWNALLDWSSGFWPLSVALAVAALAAIRRSEQRVLLLCWVLLPLVLLTGAELIRPIYFARYLLFTMLGLIVATALGVAAIRSGVLRRVVAVVLITESVFALGLRADDPAREPSVQVVQLLAAEQRSGEPVVAADGRVALDLETNLGSANRLQADLVLPPTEFTSSATSDVAWLVRVVVHQGSIPVMPAEQLLIDGGWTLQTSTLLTGLDVDLKVERWVHP